MLELQNGMAQSLASDAMQALFQCMCTLVDACVRIRVQMYISKLAFSLKRQSLISISFHVLIYGFAFNSTLLLVRNTFR